MGVLKKFRPDRKKKLRIIVTNKKIKKMMLGHYGWLDFWKGDRLKKLSVSLHSDSVKMYTQILFVYCVTSIQSINSHIFFSTFRQLPVQIFGILSVFFTDLCTFFHPNMASRRVSPDNLLFS